MSKWSRTYWTDLAERTVASALGGVLTMLGLSVADLLASTPEAWVTVVGIPAATALVKGLLANLADPTSGPSAVPSPPAPDVTD